MPQQPDEFDALRTIIETLKPFESKVQQQLLRWTQERLGLSAVPVAKTATVIPITANAEAPLAPMPVIAGGLDIKSFMAAKNPRSDNQFTAAVAYYYQFEAPQAERKSEINKDDLITAARLAARRRPARPNQTLIHSHHQGLLDKGSAPGFYKLNSVGENLVAMVLPGEPNGASQMPPKRKKAVGAKKVAKKAAKSKKG